MPFAEEFDDVFHIILDSGRQAAADNGVGVKVYRADEIAQPGRISVQVLEAIRSADLIIADLTGSNPNVMYELGFAHALEKQVVILNQTINDAPFDVKDFRQIMYDRSKLLRDCRPRLVTAINATISAAGSGGGSGSGSTGGTTGDSLGNSAGGSMGISGGSLSGGSGGEFAGNSAGNAAGAPRGTARTAAAVVRRPGPALFAELQAVHVKLEMARKVSHDKSVPRKLGVELRELVDTVSVVGRVEDDDDRFTAGALGNCAVELELSQEYELARSLFTRAISLFPDYPGLRLQYADFLFDQGEEEGAQVELDKAKSLDPSDERISRLETKFRVKSSDGPATTPEMLAALRATFEANPAASETVIPYLLALDADGATQSDEYERVCEAWAAALPADEAYMAKRALGDFLTKTDAPRAVEIYESLLDSDSHIPDDERRATMHNLATLLARTDQERAIHYWTTVYNMDRTDSVVTASFSQRLARWGKLDLAMKVVSGEPI